MLKGAGGNTNPPTFGVEILFYLTYSNIYKGIRSFELVLWMQHQCPVVRPKGSCLVSDFPANLMKYGLAARFYDHIL